MYENRTWLTSVIYFIFKAVNVWYARWNCVSRFRRVIKGFCCLNAVSQQIQFSSFLDYFRDLSVGFPNVLANQRANNCTCNLRRWLAKQLKKKKTTTTEMSEINQSIVVRHVSLSFSLIPRAARLSPLAERIGRFWGRERVNWTFDERTFWFSGHVFHKHCVPEAACVLCFHQNLTTLGTKVLWPDKTPKTNKYSVISEVI